MASACVVAACRAWVRSRDCCRDLPSRLEDMAVPGHMAAAVLLLKILMHSNALIIIHGNNLAVSNSSKNWNPAGTGCAVGQDRGPWLLSRWEQARAYIAARCPRP